MSAPKSVLHFSPRNFNCNSLWLTYLWPRCRRVSLIKNAKQLSLSLCFSTSIHTFMPALSAFTVKVPELWLELPLGARRTTRSGSKAQQIQWAAIICPFLARTLPPHFSLSPTISLRVWMGPQIRVPVKTKWPTSFHKTEVDNGRGTGNGGDVLSSRFVLLFTAVSAAAGNVF